MSSYSEKINKQLSLDTVASRNCDNCGIPTEEPIQGINGNYCSEDCRTVSYKEFQRAKQAT